MKRTAINRFLVAFTILLSLTMVGQSGNKDLARETYVVSGNCDMCKNTIESAAKTKGVKKASWEPGTKKLTIEYDPARTSVEEILRQVAYAGYDNEKYLAPKKAYDKLPGCCQYDRKDQQVAVNPKHDDHVSHQAHTDAKPEVQRSKDSSETKAPAAVSQPGESGIKAVYNNYFQLKDALVKSSAPASAEAAKKLLGSMDAVNSSAFKEKEHDSYMKYINKLKADAKLIAENKNIEKQRAAFSALSGSMFELMQDIRPGYEVFLDHCPMYNDGKGADWISKEKAIKNPYYGSKMLTCGSVKNTIK